MRRKEKGGEGKRGGGREYSQATENLPPGPGPQGQKGTGTGPGDIR